MRTNILIAILFLFTRSLFAQEITLNKINPIDSLNNSLISQNPFFSKRNNSIVPTLIKYSSWNNNLWRPSEATINKYTNNLLRSTIVYNYQLTDTINITEYSYDSIGNITSITSYYKDSNIIIPSNKKTISYSNNYLQKQTIIDIYSSITVDWTPFEKIVEEIDKKGNIYKNIREKYINNNWILYDGRITNRTYLNNTTNKFTERIDTIIDSKTNQKVPYFKESRIYNSNEEVITISKFEYKNSWELVSYDSLFYQSTILDSIRGYSFNAVDNTYQLGSKIDSFIWIGYNPNIDIDNNIPISYIKSYKAPNINGLRKTYRFRTEFPDNNGSKYLIEEYTNGPNTWQLYSRKTNIIDSKGNPTEYTGEMYDTNNKNWIIKYGQRSIFQFYSNNSISEEIYQVFDADNLIQYINRGKSEYFDYINITQGFNTYVNTLETKVYPNPTSNGSVSINLNLEKESSIYIDVIDLNGEIISKQNQQFGQGLNTIQLDGLTQGLYFVVISSDYGVSRTKLMVTGE